MPRPGEDRSDVGGAVQFTNIGPVPLSRFLSRFLASLSRFRTCPAFSPQCNIGPVPLSPPSRFLALSRFLPPSRFSPPCPAFSPPCPAFSPPVPLSPPQGNKRPGRTIGRSRAVEVPWFAPRKSIRARLWLAGGNAHHASQDGPGEAIAETGGQGGRPAETWGAPGGDSRAVGR